jgi:hypothetical protein
LTTKKKDKPASSGKKDKKSRSVAVDERDKTPEKFEEDGELFETQVNTLPSLERKGREIADRRTRIAKLREQEKGLVAEALILMHQHEIKRYNKHGVELFIDETESLKVTVD